MANDEKLKSVIPVIDNDKFVNEYRQFLVSWSKLVHVLPVIEHEERSSINVHTVMQLAKYEIKSNKQSIYQRVSKMV